MRNWKLVKLSSFQLRFVIVLCQAYISRPTIFQQIIYDCSDDVCVYSAFKYTRAQFKHAQDFEKSRKNTVVCAGLASLST